MVAGSRAESGAAGARLEGRRHWRTGAGLGCAARGSSTVLESMRTLARRRLEPRERPDDAVLVRHLPYVAAVTDDVLMLRDGEIMATFAVDGIGAAARLEDAGPEEGEEQPDEISSDNVGDDRDSLTAQLTDLELDMWQASEAMDFETE